MSGFLSRCSSTRLFYTKGNLTSDTTCTSKSCEHRVFSALGGRKGSTRDLRHGGMDRTDCETNALSADGVRSMWNLLGKFSSMECGMLWNS